ncbi:MAG: hypothetical protein PUB87_02990 [Eubacteriaceae bacterium]|nr:hypothetical protein [Eubacteriaceae bacterium]
MRKTTVWEMTKLNLLLARDDSAATVGLIAIGIVTVLMIDVYFPLSIVGFFCVVIGVTFLSRTLYRIFVDSRYGDTGILINMLPVSEKIIQRGRYIAGLLCVFFAVLGFYLTVCGLYLEINGFSLEKLTSFLKWLYCGNIYSYSDKQIYLILIAEILFFLMLSTCITAAYEYSANRSHKRNPGTKIERNNAGVSITWIVFLSTTVIPRMILDRNINISPVLLIFSKIAVLAALSFIFHRLSSKTGRAVSKKKEVKVFDENYSLSKKKAYSKLVSVNGKMSDWTSVALIIPAMLLLLDKLHISGSLIIILLNTVMCTLATQVQEWNTSLLFDENASFYYMLPIRTEDLVKTHIKIGFKCMFILPMLFYIIIAGCTALGFESASMDTMIPELLGPVNNRFETIVGFIILILITAAITLALSGWAIFNTTFASKWRDPVTHKTSRFASGLCLAGEAAMHIILLVALMPFKHINPINGSLVILAICIAESYLAYRLSVYELKETYTV